MHHPIVSDTRLVGPATRLYRRFFHKDDPHGWADYHCVEEPEGTLWIHTHGLRRWRLPDLEFVGVPARMRGYAEQLMFEFVAHGRKSQMLGGDMDIEGIFSAPRQNFRQLATLRWVLHEDRQHQDTLRIVDWDQPRDSGFPRRLFASHIAAWAEFAQTPESKEAMCRRALAIFPGNFLEMTAGADIVPGKADLTDLQQRANLPVYLSLAESLFAQGRAGEACGYLEEAIARCPGWAQTWRGYLVGKYRRKDAFMNFWREVDIPEICGRHRPANTTGPMPKPRPAAKRKPAARRLKRSA